MITQIFKWECDSIACNAKGEVSHYKGLPGWHWYIAEGQVKHACEKCSENMKSAGWFVNPKLEPNSLNFKNNWATAIAYLISLKDAAKRFKLNNNFKNYKPGAPLAVIKTNKSPHHNDLAYWNGQAWVYVTTN